MNRAPHFFRTNFTHHCVLLSLLASVTFGGLGICQDAKVASSLQIRPQAKERKIEVSLRLVDAHNIVSASGSTDSATGSKAVPTKWSGFATGTKSKCAWLVVIDNSNPARQRTVDACLQEVRQLVSKLPDSDPVMIATLARDFVVISPFEAKADERDAALGVVKTDGESSLATLIYQNLRQAMTEHLGKRDEPRKAVVLLTDGKDETPGGPEAIRSRRDELIAKAKELKVMIHTIGFAERASEANWFADLKEVSIETEGLHLAAEVATRKLPPDTWTTLEGVTRGGGTAVLDVSGLEKPTPVKLELRTAEGRRAVVVIPLAQVDKALPPKETPKTGAAVTPTPDGGPAPAEGEESPPLADPTEAPESETTDVPTEVEKEATPPWFWWAVGGGVALLLVILLVVFLRKRAADDARRADALREAEQARILEEMLSHEHTAPDQVVVEPVALAYLEMCDANQTRHPVAVTNLRIGRGQHNDLVLRNDSVSGNHCTLTRNRQGEWVLTDLKSGNGVIVNGVQVKEAVLRQGDVIELGDLKMRFLLNM
jgi:hypothetical protein